jgi:hypothetical protein
LAEHGVLEVVINLQSILGIIGADAHLRDLAPSQGTWDAEDLAEAGAEVFVHGEYEIEGTSAIEEEGFFLGFGGWLGGIGVVGEGWGCGGNGKDYESDGKE